MGYCCRGNVQEERYEGRGVDAYDTAQTGNRGAAKEPPTVPQYAVVDKSKKKPPALPQYAVVDKSKKKPKVRIWLSKIISN